MKQTRPTSGGFLKLQRGDVAGADVQVIEVSAMGEGATKVPIVKYLGGDTGDLELEVAAGKYVVRMHSLRVPTQAEIVVVKAGEKTSLQADMPYSQAHPARKILPPPSADSKQYSESKPHRSGDLISLSDLNDTIDQFSRLPKTFGAAQYQLWTQGERSSLNIPKIEHGENKDVFEWWCRDFESLGKPQHLQRSTLRVFNAGDQRAYASFISADARMLLCPYLLGWPHPSVPSGIAPASIELIKAPKTRPAWTSHLAARIDDPEFNTCMGFLNDGNTVATAAVLRGSSTMLYEKIENPIAAAGGALALLALASDTQWEGEWRNWIHNLFIWFPRLPDAAVVRAMCYLRFGDVSVDDHIDIEILREFALSAVKRGLPYFSRSVHELLEILRLIQMDDDASGRFGPQVSDTANATHLVKQLAQLLVPGEIFTSLALDLN